MEYESSDPIKEAIETIQKQWQDRADASGRVFKTILNCNEYHHYSTIAEQANCAENTAKKHLDRLVDMGLVKRDTKHKMAKYRRSRPYIEWWIAQRIASNYSVGEITNRIKELEEKQLELEIHFDDLDLTPKEIYMMEMASSVSEQLEAVTEWQYTEQRIRYHQLAFQISRFNDRFMPRLGTNKIPRIKDIPE